MNRRMRKFRDLKIGTQLAVAFLLCGLLPLLGIQIFNLQISKRALEDKVNTLRTQQLEQIAERVDLNLDNYTSILYQMDADEYLKEKIKEFVQGDSSKRALAQHNIYQQLQSYRIADEEIQCISLICEDGSHVTYDWNAASMVENIWKDYIDMRLIPPYVNASDSREAVITPTMRFGLAEEGESLFHISKKLYDFKNVDQEPLATVVISVDETLLRKLCRLQSEKEEGRKKNINFILNKDGVIISYPDAGYNGSSLKKDQDMESFVSMTGQLDRKEISVNAYEDVRNGWIFYNAYDTEYIFRDVRRNMGLLLLVGFMVMGIAATLMATIISSVKKSADRITRGIQKIQQGDLQVHVEVDSRDEFGQIAENLNTMTGKIRNLILQVEEIADKKKDAEIKALEAQINPHFLYNTLDSINWMAISHREYEVSEMICNLASILRYSVDKSNQMTTIREMGDWMEKYIKLQQMRFHNSFEYELNIEPEVLGIKTYKLLLQPFLENSLLHGFKKMDSGGFLRVDIFQSEDRDFFHVTIEDNGEGMPLTTKAFLNDRQRVLKEGYHRIGLCNVFTRLNMYYGESAVWKISSKEGFGTVITLRIPVRRKKYEDISG